MQITEIKVMSFMKKGKEAAKQYKQEQAADKQRQAQRDSGVNTFWIKKGEDKTVTFLDGDLMSDGVLSMTSYYRHMVPEGKFYNPYVCTQFEDDTQPCPLCEELDNFASMVGVFTVIDHTEFTDRKGKKHKDQICLFVAGKRTLDILQKHATKRGGLAGATFDVSRSNGDQSPRVGDMFDFIEKKSDKKLKKKFPKAKVIKYEKAVTYLSPEQLREAGVGGLEPDEKSKKGKKKKTGKGKKKPAKKTDKKKTPPKKKGGGKVPKGKGKKGKKKSGKDSEYYED